MTLYDMLTDDDKQILEETVARYAEENGDYPTWLRLMDEDIDVADDDPEAQPIAEEAEAYAEYEEYLAEETA